MAIIDEELEKRFLEVGSQENEPDPLVICKISDTCGNSSWFATSYDPENRMFHGYKRSLASFWGKWEHFSLDELSEIKTFPLDLPLSRDLHCGEKRISQHCPELAEIIKRKKELLEIEHNKELSLDDDLER